MLARKKMKFRSVPQNTVSGGGLLYFAERNGTLKNTVIRAHTYTKPAKMASNRWNVSFFAKIFLVWRHIRISKICSFNVCLAMIWRSFARKTHKILFSKRLVHCIKQLIILQKWRHCDVTKSVDVILWRHVYVVIIKTYYLTKLCLYCVVQVFFF